MNSEINKASIIEEVIAKLAPHGIIPQSNPVLRMDSHNMTVTDGSSFFVKILGLANSLENFNMEILASKKIANTPQLLLLEPISINSRPATVWKYINGVTPSIDDLTPQNIKAIILQLEIIRKTNLKDFPRIRNLSQVASTANRRLASEKGLSMPRSLQKELRVLVDTFILPMSEGALQGEVICHSDVHAGNIMILPDGVLQVIDYESLKLAPPEQDLACLYQNLVQLGGRNDLYEIAEEEFLAFRSIDKDLLRRIILMRNVSTTTYTIAFGDWDLVADRAREISKSIKTSTPPLRIRPVS